MSEEQNEIPGAGAAPANEPRFQLQKIDLYGT